MRTLFPSLFAAAALVAGCGSPAGRAAKQDAAAIGHHAAAADTTVGRTQAANAAIAADAARLAAGDRAIRTNAERIDDKAVVLLKSRWQP